MWCRKQPNGRYKYTESYKDPITGKRKEVSVTLRGDSKLYQGQAQGLLYEKIKQKTDPLNFYKAMPFEVVANEWLKDSNIGITSGTHLNHEQQVKRILKFLPEGILLRAIDVNQLKEFNQRLISNRYARGTIVSTIRQFQRIMSFAWDKKYIAYSREIDHYKLIHMSVTEEEVQKIRSKFLEHEELRECLQQLYAINKRIALLCEFLVRTGLRIGEALALREKDYFKSTADDGTIKARINVNGTINYQTKERTPTKTIAGVRDVALDNEAVNILDSIIKENKLYKKASIDEEFNATGYIFITLNESRTRNGKKGGKPYDSKYVNDMLKPLKVNGKK